MKWNGDNEMLNAYGGRVDWNTKYELSNLALRVLSEIVVPLSTKLGVPEKLFCKECF